MSIIGTSAAHRSARRLAVTLAAASLVVTSACSNSRSSEGADDAASCDNAAYESADIDWTQFSGETITLSAQQHPWWETIEPLIGCFHELTGITVEPTVLGEDQYVSRIAVELSAGSSEPDVFMVNQFGQAAGSGWLEPLDPLLEDPTLTDAEWYDQGDFFTGAAEYGQSDGDTLALPVTAEVQMLFVRDDLIPEAPTTMDELLAAAESSNGDGVAGFGSRAVAAANQTPWAFGGFAFSEGGEYLDSDGNPRFDSPENVTALEIYSSLLADYGPAGASSWGFQENQQSMQQGSLAMWADSSTFLGSLKDPESSQYADEISAYPFPVGASGESIPAAWFWTVGINSKSEHVDAAWLFLQWATSAPVSAAGAENGASPARSSAWGSDTVGATIGTDNATRIQEALEQLDSTALSNAWKESDWSEISDPLARAVNAAVAGGDPSRELAQAQQAAESAGS